MLIVILLALMTLAALFVVFSRDLLHAVISLGFLSIFTSILFYTFGSPYASIMELSIGAGLITILFMATISLVEQPRAQQGKIFGLTYLNVFSLLVIAAIALYVGFSLVEGGAPSPVATVSPPTQTLPQTLWGDRLLDVLGLGIIIFTAALGMGVLFRTEGGK